MISAYTSRAVRITKMLWQGDHLNETECKLWSNLAVFQLTQLAIGITMSSEAARGSIVVAIRWQNATTQDSGNILRIFHPAANSATSVTPSHKDHQWVGDICTQRHLRFVSRVQYINFFSLFSCCLNSHSMTPIFREPLAGTLLHLKFC